MKILIADDHNLIIEDLKNELHRLMPDAVCDGTSDPKEILTLFGKNEYDIVFMDIMMPGQNGILLAPKILEKNPRTNIIYITGYPDYALKTFSTHPSGFLVKPVTTEALKDALAHLRFPVSDITNEMIQSEFAGNAVIGKKIQKFREERGMSKQELADEMGVALQTVYRWENGEREPDIATFMKLLKTLGVDLGKAME